MQFQWLRYQPTVSGTALHQQLSHSSDASALTSTRTACNLHSDRNGYANSLQIHVFRKANSSLYDPCRYRGGRRGCCNTAYRYKKPEGIRQYTLNIQIVLLLSPVCFKMLETLINSTVKFILVTAI